VKIARAQVFSYALPLAPPVSLAGEAVETREGFLLQLRSEEGHTGWGEAAPLPGFSSETVAEAAVELHQLTEELEGFTLLEHAGFVRLLGGVAAPSVAFALESAWLNLHAAMSGVEAFRLLRSNAPMAVPLSALLTGTPEEQLARAAEAAAAGFRCLKLKLGRGEIADEIDLVRQLKARLPAGVTLRGDANRAWRLEQALEFCEGVGADTFVYLEEPLEDPQLLPEFLRESGQRYAVDETLQEVVGRMSRRRGVVGEADQHLLEVLAQAAAWVWKPSLVHVQYLMAAWRRFEPQPPLVLSAAYESGVGIAAIANYATAFSAPETAAGLDTYRVLAEDLLQVPLPLRGAEATLAALNQAAASVDTTRLFDAP